MAKRRGTPATQRGRETILYPRRLPEGEAEFRHRCMFCDAATAELNRDPYFRYRVYQCDTEAWRLGDVIQGVDCQNRVDRDINGRWRQ